MDLLEHLLEQYYSNFRLVSSRFVSGWTCPSRLPTSLIRKFTIESAPGMSEREAVIHAIGNVHTPFTLVYGKETMSMFDLERPPFSSERQQTLASPLISRLVVNGLTAEMNRSHRSPFSISFIKRIG